MQTAAWEAELAGGSLGCWHSDAWEPALAAGPSGSLPTYINQEHAECSTEANSVESWQSWDAPAEEATAEETACTSWFEPAEEATAGYTQPPTTALFEHHSLSVSSGEDTVECYLKRPAPANQKRPISQSLEIGFDGQTKQEPGGVGPSAEITCVCPNCGEAKGSKGTWCRSVSCVSRRESTNKNKTSLRRADTSTVFQCDEPAYRTPPSADAEATQRPGSGEPFCESIKAPADLTLNGQQSTAVRETSQPVEQHAGSRSPSLAPNASPRERFYAEVYQLQEAAGTPFVKAPTVGMKTLDLFTLYQEVSALGGMHEVVSKKLWKSVAMTLKLPTTCTDYGFRLRKHFERYLLVYEQKHLGTAPPQKTGDNKRRKRKQRSERVNRQSEQDKEERAANPYSKRAYYNHA
jgi:hypothetical protein